MPLSAIVTADTLGPSIRSADDSAPVLDAILRLLTAKYPTEEILTTTDIFATGLADSQVFLDIIFDVEKGTGWLCEFDLLNFDETMTPLKMARAFQAPATAGASSPTLPAPIRPWLWRWLVRKCFN